MTSLPDQTEKPHYIKCGPVPVLRDWRSLPTKDLTRAERNMAFCERLLMMPTADGRVIPIRFIPEQESFWRAIFDNPEGTRQAIYSIARRNGKSFLVSCILLCFLIGPEAKLNAKLCSGAMSREQAAIIFQQAKEIVLVSPKVTGLVGIVPSSKILKGFPLDTEYRSLSAEGKTALGHSFALVLLDECGQIEAPTSEFVSALISSQGSHKDPLMIFLSTQAPTDSALLSRLIDDAESSQSDHIVCHLHAAPDDCDLLDQEAWAMANPGLGQFRDKKDLEEQLKQATRLPALEQQARNLLLNQRCNVDAPFVSKATWQENGAEPDRTGRKKVFGGLDLSAVADLTALVFVTEDGDVLCKCWLPSEGIGEKSRADRVPYDVWVKQGFLNTTPGKSIEYEYIAYELKRIFDEYDVQQINFDRFAMKFLLPWLKKAGLNDKQIEKFNEFGQGFVSMGNAVRELESKLLQGKLKHGNHPVLSMCAGNAKVEMDAAGGRKFTKKKSTGRIDAMVALAMAVDALARYEESKPSEPTLFFV